MLFVYVYIQIHVCQHNDSTAGRGSVTIFAIEPSLATSCFSNQKVKGHRDCLSLSLRFSGHSPGEPGLAGVY